MAVFSGTNIVNDGLVFHFDLQNSVKSWKGKPSLNLITDPFALNGAPSPLYMSETSYESIKTRESVLPNAEMYDISPFWYKSVKDVSNNGRVFFLQIGGLEINTNYCFSFYAYTDDTRVSSIRATSDNTNNSPLVSLTNYNMTKRGQIQRVYCIFKSTAGGQTIGVRVGSSDSIGSTFWYTGIQVEKGSFPTRVINGVRLDTANIIDVSPKKNSIRAQNLTYRQDDTPTFDGTDDFFEITTTVNAKTVIAWIKIAVADGSEGIIYGPTANGHDNWFAIASNQVKIFATQTADVNNTSTFGGTELSANTWYQVGMSIDDDTVRAYLNGDLDGTSVKAFTVGAWNSVASIGRRGNIAQRYFNGEIDQVKVYDRVLTADEIKQNFEATRSRYGI